VRSLCRLYPGRLGETVTGMPRRIRGASTSKLSDSMFRFKRRLWRYGLWKWAWDCDRIVAIEGSSRASVLEVFPGHDQRRIFAFRGWCRIDNMRMWMWMLIQQKKEGGNF
jgi:hypothetical protein